MPARTSRSLDEVLEFLCQKGCRRVWGEIARLERGEDPEGVGPLSVAERRWLLGELGQIMAVYEDRCAVDDPD